MILRSDFALHIIHTALKRSICCARTILLSLCQQLRVLCNIDWWIARILGHINDHRRFARIILLAISQEVWALEVKELELAIHKHIFV